MERGIGFLEILISLAIVGIVITIVFVSFASLSESNELIEAHSAITGLLRDARAKTLSSQSNTTYGVHFEETKAVLFKGGSYNASLPSNETYLLPKRTKISSISLGGGADTVFERLTGRASPSGEVVVAARRNLSKNKTVFILQTGNFK